MLVLLAGTFLGAGIGGLVFGLPGAVFGATNGAMIAAIILLNRE
jgi:hypothetical protein